MWAAKQGWQRRSLGVRAARAAVPLPVHACSMLRALSPDTLPALTVSGGSRAAASARSSPMRLVFLPLALEAEPADECHLAPPIPLVVAAGSAGGRDPRGSKGGSRAGGRAGARAAGVQQTNLRAELAAAVFFPGGTSAQEHLQTPS